MNDGRIDLLPPLYGARARLRLLNRRLAATVGCTVLVLGALVLHARVVRSGAESELTEARERAELVLSAERREAALVDEIESTGRRIEAWRDIALPLPVGGLLVTMTNTLPDDVILDRLQVDVTGIRVDSRGRRSDHRRLLGRLQGLAPDEATVRRFVMELREREPFEEIRRGHTALVERGERVLTSFSVDFEVDLDRPWRVADGTPARTAQADGGAP